MRSFKGVLLCALALTLILLAHESWANGLISPQLSISPQIFPKGVRSSTFLTITNQNPASTAVLNQGDTFTLSPRECGIWSSVSGVFVNSGNLSASDFSAKLVSAGSSKNIVITYINPDPEKFAPGDSLAVKLTLSPKKVVGTGTVTFSGPANATTRFGAPSPKYTAISSVDFPKAPTRIEVTKDMTDAGWSCYADAHCPAGMRVLGGGGSIAYTSDTNNGPLHYHLMSSYPADDSGWLAAWQCEGIGCTGITEVHMKVYAICQ